MKIEQEGASVKKCSNNQAYYYDSLQQHL